MSTMKRCSKCKASKPIDQFGIDRSRKDGRNPWCKKCKNLFYHGDYARSKVEAGLPYWNMRMRKGNKYGMTGKQAMDMYLSHPYCHYCGIELEAHKCHFDHLLPDSKGGSSDEDNLVIACADCNHLKWDRTEKEFLDFIDGYCSRFANRVTH